MRPDVDGRGAGARVRKAEGRQVGRTSAGILLWRVGRVAWRCCSATPAVRTAGKDARSLDGAQRARRTLARTCLPSPGASSRRRRGTDRREGPTIELGEIRQKSGKRVLAWAVEGDLDTRPP